jgi:hypothetical protein
MTINYPHKLTSRLSPGTGTLSRYDIALRLLGKCRLLFGPVAVSAVAR